MIADLTDEQVRRSFRTDGKDFPRCEGNSSAASWLRCIHRNREGVAEPASRLRTTFCLNWARYFAKGVVARHSAQTIKIPRLMCQRL